MNNNQLTETNLDHAKNALHRAAYLASIGGNDPKKLDAVYHLICDAIDLISEAKNEEAA